MALGGRSLRVRRLGGTRAGEIRLTRFLRNDAVTVGEMLAEARQRTAARCEGRDVLAIQDTTVIRSEAGRCELDLPARPGRRARTAQVALRFATPSLARPKAGDRAGLPAAVTLQVVDVREASPPPGEAPVHWRLLTTHPVGNAAEAWAVAEIYRKRWAIEQLFRAL